MNFTPLTARTALALVATLGLLACATAPRATLADYAPTSPPVGQVIETQRSVLRALGSSPLAVEVKAELRQATEWLDRAENLAAAEVPDEARLAVVLDTIEGQLVMIKTLYDRRAADAAAGLPTRPELSP